MRISKVGFKRNMFISIYMGLEMVKGQHCMARKDKVTGEVSQ